MNPNPVINAGESCMFLALGVQDRYPAVPSVSRYLVRQCVRTTLGQLLGYVSAVWLSHTQCALAVEYCDVITLASREFRVLLAVLPTSLRCLHIFGFVWVAGCCDLTFLAYTHGLLS